TVPAGVNATVNGATVSFVADSYTVDTPLNFTVAVSDGTDSVTESVTVTVLKEGGSTGCTNVWANGSVYNAGDIVTHSGKSWKAKWWTTGEEP
ncbi:carbohydrate-binding protein, partial [Photobacterium sp. R1]